MDYRHLGHCLDCGYSLRGLTEPRCPECGRPFVPTDVTTMRIGPPLGWLGRLAIKPMGWLTHLLVVGWVLLIFYFEQREALRRFDFDIAFLVIGGLIGFSPVLVMLSVRKTLQYWFASSRPHLKPRMFATWRGYLVAPVMFLIFALVQTRVPALIFFTPSRPFFSRVARREAARVEQPIWDNPAGYDAERFEDARWNIPRSGVHHRWIGLYGVRTIQRVRGGIVLFELDHLNCYIAYDPTGVPPPGTFSQAVPLGGDWYLWE